MLILLDFSNAFGSVDHQRLLQVMKSVGVRGNSFNWFDSFLNGWKQKVKFADKCSQSNNIQRGIIQGENNSQLLFSIFINNIVKYIKKLKIALFADDVQLYVECDVNELENIIYEINDELKCIEKFCKDYGLDINPKKSNALIISSKYNQRSINYENLPKIVISNQEIDFVESARDLGYMINRTLNNTDHIKTVLKKTYGGLNALQPLKKLLPSDIKLQLIKSLILPIFDYMDVVYHDFGIHGTNQDSDRLEKMLNCCIRFITNIKRSDHITPHRNSLRLLSLFDRRSLHIANIIWKIMNNKAPEYLNDILILNKNNTRSNNKLIIQKPNSNSHKSSLFIGGPKLWNSIPDDIKECKSYKTFSKHYEKYLLDRNSN